MAAQWYYAKKNGEREGPVSPAKLKQLATDGWLTPDDLVWKEGLPDWLPAKKVRGLFKNTLVQALAGKVDGVVIRDPPPVASRLSPPAKEPTLFQRFYEQAVETLRWTVERIGTASREAAERRQEARRIALEHKKLDIEAKRLAQEQPVMETAVVPGGSGNVVVINQAPIRKWSPGLAAALSFFIPGLGQLYKGQILNGLVWFFFVGMGYVALIVPGLVLHFFCVLGALSGNPWTEAKTTVVRQ